MGISVPFVVGCKHFLRAGGGIERKPFDGEPEVARAPRVGSCGGEEIERQRIVRTETRGDGNGEMGDRRMGKCGDGGLYCEQFARPLSFSVHGVAHARAILDLRIQAQFFIIF